MENYIVEKILNDANAEAAVITADAKKAAAERVRRTEADIVRETESAMERARRKVRDEERQAEIVAKTQTMRARISNKQAVIDDIFADVRKQLLGMNAKDAQLLVTNLVKKHGRSGDTVVISKADEKNISSTFIAGLPVKNLKTKVSSDFEGGVILQNATYDLSLTLDELLVELRTEIELEISKILF
ncbi:MAG: V-type ATP synthase subunit E family protein [Firmicutes bacterium]|nr:V-type ATP synthase subunit E family protein [Bacillota bacterium]